MLFNSYTYILAFFPFVAITYFLASKYLDRKLVTCWLVIASLFYYAWWNPIYLPIIIGSALFNYYLGAEIRRRRSTKYAYYLMVFGVVANLLALGYFKYFNFFIDNVNALFNSDIYIAPIFLPLALSFFTFTQIAYLADVHAGKFEDYDIVSYLLFVTFFPHLIAGPIVHHTEMMSQFDKHDTYRPRRRNIELGLSLFSIGLFKKVVLADSIAPFSSPIFSAVDSGTSLSMFENWIGATAFGLQVYFDFSAYTDMAIGSSILFGIKLPINFYSPYKSLNISEFWRRWHMSLTRLITAYIYTPMSIARVRKAVAENSSETAIFWKSAAYPVMVTFILAGVWHGAGWNFVIFGALQGSMMIVNNLWRQFRKTTLKQDLKKTTLAGRILARGLTSACFIFSLVFFKATTTTGALMMAKSMLGLDGLSLAHSIVSAKIFLVYALAYFSIIFLLPNTQQLFSHYEPSLEPRRNETLWGLENLVWVPNKQWAMICSIMFAVALMDMNKVSEFIYFQF